MLFQLFNSLRGFFTFTASYSNQVFKEPLSKEEEEEIAHYLDKIVPDFDSLIAEKESLIKDLESYKKSLIYEAVTGKRRVV